MDDDVVRSGSFTRIRKFKLELILNLFNLSEIVSKIYKYLDGSKILPYQMTSKIKTKNDTLNQERTNPDRSDRS